MERLQTNLFSDNRCSSCRVIIAKNQNNEAAKFACGHIAHIGCLDNAYVSFVKRHRNLNFICLRSRCNHAVTLEALKQALPKTESGKTALRCILLRLLQEQETFPNTTAENHGVQRIDERIQLKCWLELGNSLNLSTQDQDEERVILSTSGNEETLINRRFAYIRALELALTTSASRIVQKIAKQLITLNMLADDIDDHGGLVLNGVGRDKEEIVNWANGINLPFENRIRLVDNAPAPPINHETLAQQVNEMRISDPENRYGQGHNVHNAASIRLANEIYQAMQHRAQLAYPIEITRRQIQDIVQDNANALRALELLCDNHPNFQSEQFSFTVRQALCTVWSYICSQPEPLKGDLINQLRLQMSEMIQGTNPHCYTGRMVRLLHTPLAIDHSLIDRNTFDATQLVDEIRNKCSKIMEREVQAANAYQQSGAVMDDALLEVITRQQVDAWTKVAFTERGIDPVVTRQLLEMAWPEGASIF